MHTETASHFGEWTAASDSTVLLDLEGAERGKTPSTLSCEGFWASIASALYFLFGDVCMLPEVLKQEQFSCRKSAPHSVSLSTLTEVIPR